MLQDRGVLGPAFLFFVSPFPMVLWGGGLCLGYSIHGCPVSVPCPQGAVRPTLSPVYMRQASTSNSSTCATLWLVCEVYWVGANGIPSFPSLLAWAWHAQCSFRAVMFPYWIKSLWALLPLWAPAALLWWICEVPWKRTNRSPSCPSLLACLLHVRGPCTVAESLFWAYFPCLRHTVPNKGPAFPIVQLSDQPRVYLGHGQSWATFFSYRPSWQPQSQPGCATSCVCLTESLSPQWL